jgi:hypothetical protein
MIGVLGFDSRRGLGIFLFTAASRTALGPTQPPIQWVPGALSLGVKRLGREADRSPPSSAEVKEWNYTSTPQYAFMAWCSVKTQGQLYLYLYHGLISSLFKMTRFSLALAYVGNFPSRSLEPLLEDDEESIHCAHRETAGGCVHFCVVCDRGKMYWQCLPSQIFRWDFNGR